MTTLPQDEQPLGAAPVRGGRLRDGLHRFVVHAAFGTQEFPCVLELLDRRSLELRVLALADPAADMVRIPAGTLQLEAKGPPSGLAGRAIDVPEFWLDRCEVTVEDYLQFARATQRDPPFGLANPPAEKRRWPVVNVTWDDAVAYAVFRGKRLPTQAEWMLAARGPGPAPRRHPWLDAGLRGNCQVQQDHRGWTPEEVTAAFWRHAVAVDSTPDSASPEGVRELFGNVEEWTESLAIDLGLAVDHRSRVVCGLTWFTLSVAPGEDLATTVFSTASRPVAYRGFRCARSTSPP